MSYIAGAASEWRMLQQLEGRIFPKSLAAETKHHFLLCVSGLKETATLLRMATTASVIDGGFNRALGILALDRPLQAMELQSLIVFADKVVTVFQAEAETRAFLSLEPGHAQYMAPDYPLFGEEVNDAFPLAAMEIADAGRCRAAGLWTACVMHLMRAVEEPLNALATFVGVPVNQNWNTALNQIDSKLRERSKSTHGQEEEQWASEASAHLRAIKNAWRNYAQHGRTRYNEAEAVAIWSNVQYLMQTLAKKLGGSGG